MADEKAIQQVGLLTNPNRNALPPGALLVADNVVIDQVGTIQPRPGYTVGNSTGDIPTQVQSCRLVSYSPDPTRATSTQRFFIDFLFTSTTVGACAVSDVSNPWIQVTTFENPSGNFAHPYEAMVSRGNLYSTGFAGMQKFTFTGPPSTLSAVSTNPAGMPRGLPSRSPGVTNIGAAPVNWFVDGNTVGYRTCFLRTDINGYTVRGAPSGQFRVSNRSGSLSLVTMVLPLPSYTSTPLVQVGDVLEIYRGAQVDNTVVPTEPPDDMNLVASITLTASQIASLVVTFIDEVADELRQTQPLLYTSPSAETIAQANETPPLCSDCLFANRIAFYGDVTTRSNFELALYGTNGYAWDGTAPIGKHVAAATISTTNGSATAVLNSGHVYVGQCVSNSANPTTAGTVFDAETVILAWNGATGLILSKPALSTSAATSTTTYDVVHVGTRNYYASSVSNIAGRQFDTMSTPSDLNDIVYLFMDTVNADDKCKVTVQPNPVGLTSSGIVWPTSGWPSVIFYEKKFNLLTASDRTCTETVDSTSGIYYSPQDFKAQSTSYPTANVYPDRVIRAMVPGGVYISKQDEPEAVPVQNLLQVGESSARVIRMVPVREAVWVFKEDGLFRISGGDITNIGFDLIDPSVRLVGPYAADVMNDVIYAWTSQGVCAISDGGSRNISQEPVGTDFSVSEQIFSPSSDTGLTQPWLICDSNQSRVLLKVGTDPSALTNEYHEYCYSLRTNGWTRWDLHRATSDGVGGTDFVATPSSGCLDNITNGAMVWSSATSTRTNPTVRRALLFEKKRNAQAFFGQSIYASDINETAVVTAVSTVATGFQLTISPSLSYVPLVGDALFSLDACIVISVTPGALSDTVIVDTSPGGAGSYTYCHRFQSTVQWGPFDMAAYDIEKTWREVRLLLDAVQNMHDYTMTYSGTPNGSTPVAVSVPIAKSNTATNVVKRIGIPRNVGREQLLLMQLTVAQAGARWDLDGINAVGVPSAERVGR